MYKNCVCRNFWYAAWRTIHKFLEAHCDWYLVCWLWSIELYYILVEIITKHKNIYTKHRWSIKTWQKHTMRTCEPYPISNDWSFARWFAISRGTNAEQLTMIRGPDVETWSKGLRSKLRYNTSITAVFERFQAPEYDWHIISLGGNGGWCYTVGRGSSGGPVAYLQDFFITQIKYINVCFVAEFSTSSSSTLLTKWKKLANTNELNSHIYTTST